MRIGNARSPLTHCFRNCIFQSCRSCFNRNHLCSKQSHTIYIKRLANGIFFAHKHHALHPHKGCSSCSGNTMLTSSGFSDQPCFSHLFCKQSLPQYVVDFMRPGMIEVFTFEIYLGAAKVFSHFLCIVQSGWSACVFI